VWLTTGCPEVAATVDGHKEEDVGGKSAAEVKFLSRLRHYNVVCMLGYVSNNLDTMMLYEYMVNDSLWEALHGKGKSKMLEEWVSWYNVTAHLTYLHQGYRSSVIHCDIKSSNVLLTPTWTPRSPTSNLPASWCELMRPSPWSPGQYQLPYTLLMCELEFVC
jgi:hypothetical protein